MFSHIFIVFPKTALFISLKKSLSKLFFAFCLCLVFISIYGFSQAFWLDSIALWTFFKINLWFNACFKFLMWITNSVLLWKLVTSYSKCLTFVPSGKNGKSLWISSNFLGCWKSTSRKYPSSLSSLYFLWNLH